MTEMSDRIKRGDVSVLGLNIHREVHFYMNRGLAY